MKKALISSAKKVMLFSALLFGLFGCSDSSTASDPPSSVSPPATPTPPVTPSPALETVTGRVFAPAGVVAHFRKPSVFEMIFPPAYAAVTGLQVVPNATVELIRVDDDGNQVGSVIATSSTSSAGAYSISLPTGVGLAGNLVLRVQGSSVKMHAIAIEHKVDINPSSHYAYQSLIDSDLVMGNLAANHVVTLRGVVNESRVSAGGNINETLAALHLVSGYRIKQELAVLTTATGTPSLFAGSWRNAALGLALQDRDDRSFGYISSSVEIIKHLINTVNPENVRFTPQSNSYKSGLVTFFQTVQGVASVLSTSTQIETSISNPKVFTANVRANGALVVRAPLSEHLYNDLGNGPNTGTQTQPLIFVFAPGGSADVKVGINQEIGVVFSTKDTNADGSFDALDLTKKIGDEPNLFFELLVRNATDLSNTVLDEKIGLVSYEVLQNTTGATTKISAGSNILSFDGAGGFSAPVNARARDEITRTPSGISFLNDTQSSAITGTYSVTSDGALSMTENAGNPRQGFVTSAGDLLVAVQVMSSQTNYRQVYSLGVKLGATPPSLSGAKYALYPMEIAYRADDTEILTFAHPGMLTFNAAGSQATLAGKSFGITRGSDLDQVMAPIDDKKTLQMTVNVSPDSTTSIVSNDGSTVLAFEGFVAADASRMVLKLKETKALGTSEAYYGLGFVFAVKVN